MGKIKSFFQKRCPIVLVLSFGAIICLLFVLLVNTVMANESNKKQIYALNSEIYSLKDQIKDLKETESLYNQCKEELLKTQGNLEMVQAQYDQLLLEYTTLQEEYEALQQKYEELEANKKTSSSSGSNSTSSSGSSEEQQDNTTVYWVPKGKKYHSTKDCVSLKRSDTILSGSISKVGSKTKCNLCW